MNNSFNVTEFQNVIDNIVTKSNAAETAMNNIVSNIDDLKNIIGNQENSSLYQAWDDLKITLNKVIKVYNARREEFLSELTNYKELVLTNNDEFYQNIRAAIEQIDLIASQIDGL